VRRYGPLPSDASEQQRAERVAQAIKFIRLAEEDKGED
jgi:hypothetical protein